MISFEWVGMKGIIKQKTGNSEKEKKERKVNRGSTVKWEGKLIRSK